MAAFEQLDSRIGSALTSLRALSVFALFARLALATAFLSSIADRFGWWGASGTGDVSWGDFSRFEDYTADVLPFLPSGLIPAAAWASTVVEILLAVALLLGVALVLFGLFAAMYHGYVEDAGMEPTSTLGFAIPCVVFGAAIAAGAWWAAR